MEGPESRDRRTAPTWGGMERPPCHRRVALGRKRGDPQGRPLICRSACAMPRVMPWLTVVASTSMQAVMGRKDLRSTGIYVQGVAGLFKGLWK
jgi:hypothetical protein